MRIVFFGTPAFSVPTLDALEQAGLCPELVVSQPSRPRGRGRKPAVPPVAKWALGRGVPLEQPVSIKRRSFRERIEGDGFDMAVVVAFGQIFTRQLLAAPRHGCINVHASLLPRHRGAAPIAAAIAAGDRKTGVTTMQMEPGLDTGPMLLVAETEIGKQETTGELTERLARLGGELLVETLRALEEGTLEPEPQDNDLATYAPTLKKEQGACSFEEPAVVLERRLRAFTPWPGLYGQFRGERLRLLDAEVVEHPPEDAGARSSGEIARVSKAGLDVVCGEGSVLRLLRVQRPGRKPLGIVDFRNGEQPEAGERFERVALASPTSSEEAP